MKYKEGIEKLGLPEIYRFGVELEAFNVHTWIPTKDRPSLYLSKYSKEFLKQHRWKTASILEESLVSQGGAECVSPILYDKKKDWQNLSDVCTHMKKYPGNYGDKVVANEKCGCHVHFDARVLTGKNVEQTEKIMHNFLKMWAESEELMYKMCNDVNQPIREGAVKNKLKGISRLVFQLQHVQGMASPIGKKILRSIEKGTLKVSHQKFGILKRIIAMGKLDPRRYRGLNLSNIGNPKKNTIEFRMSNGTLDPEVIKKNVYLYASFLRAARSSVLEPDKMSEKLQEFYRTDVTEKQKVDSFLNLLFDESSDRQIFQERWESVKDAPVFVQTQNRFVQNRFKREEFGTIAKRVPTVLVKEMFSRIKESIQTKEKGKGENYYVGPER